MSGPAPGLPRVVVVGLGNPIISDDAVGVHAARALAERLAGAPVAVSESSRGGIEFLDLLAGYDRAIIIDAIQWRRGEPGTVYRLSPADAIPTVRATSYHDIGLAQVLKLGALLGIPLPSEIVFFAVEVGDVTTVSEQVSPDVLDAIPRLVRDVEDQLAAWGVLAPTTASGRWTVDG